MTEERAATLREASAVDLDPAREILEGMRPVRPGDLIPLLQRLQGAYGYLPADVLHDVSASTGIPLSRMYGVITFYSQFSTSPRGRHTIRVCSGTACHVKGSRELLEAIHHEIGVEDNGSTTDGRFTLETVACLGTCFLAPVMMVDDEYFGSLSPAQARAILKNYA